MTTSTASCPFGFSSNTDRPPGDQLAPPIESGSQEAFAPVAEWLDPLEMLADPYPSYERLRNESPVMWAPVFNRYLITGFAECHSIEMDQEVFSADVRGSSMVRALGAKPMLRMDDPEHAVDRSAINPVLRPKNISQAWAPVFERNAELQLDVLAGMGPGEADLNRDYAAPLAARNLIDLLGVKDVTVEQMERWSHDFIAGTGNVLDDAEIWTRCEASKAEVDSLLEDLIPHYRAKPDHSMTSALANSGLPWSNVAANVKLTIAGGLNEPQHMITNVVWALSKHPEQRAAVLDSPGLWPRVFDETVRWLSPIGMYPRETTCETRLGGVHLPAGASVGVVVAAANRDAAQFGSDAPQFNVMRDRQPHLGFGSGVHLCAGHWAAKTSIGQIALPRAYERFPGLRTDEQRTETWHGWAFRGLSNHPVTWNS